MLLAKSRPSVIPIPGVRSVERLEELAKATEVELSPESVKSIRQWVDAADIHGERLPALFGHVQTTCIKPEEWKGE